MSKLALEKDLKLRADFKNIHKLPFLSIKDAYDIEVPEAHKKYGSGETWESYTKTFTKEPGDRILSFHEYEQMLRSIHPNLFVVYNWDIAFGHPVYFFLAEDFPPIFICTVGKGADNEISPESGFIGNQSDCSLIVSRWDLGNQDQVVAISEGK